MKNYYLDRSKRRVLFEKMFEDCLLIYKNGKAMTPDEWWNSYDEFKTSDLDGSIPVEYFYPNGEYANEQTK